MHRQSLCALAALSTSFLFACGSVDTRSVDTHDPSAASANDDLHTDHVSQKLNSQVVCDLIKALRDNLPAIQGSVGFFWVDCNDGNITQANGGVRDNKSITLNRYYNGSGPLNGSTSDLFITPYVTASALMCAIKDSGNVSTSAMTGPFGVSSKLDISETDTAHWNVTARRTSSLVLFGVAAPLSDQEVTFSFRKELASNNTRYGGLTDLRTTGFQWLIDSQVTFPIGPLQVTITPKLNSKSPSKTRSNNGIWFDPPTVDNMLLPKFSFATWDQCRTNPNCSKPRTDVSDADFLADHQRTCPPDITTAADHILPYDRPLGGAGCKTQPWIFIDPFNTWFEFGRAGGATLGEDEKAQDLSQQPNDNATYWADLGVQTAFDVEAVHIVVKLTLNLAARDGFAVRQRRVRPGDSPEFVEVATDFNSRASAKLHVHTDVTIPNIGTIPADFDVNLGDSGNQGWRKGSGSTTPPPPGAAVAYITYPPKEFTSFSSYDIGGVPKADPEAARSQCLFNTPTSTGLNRLPPDPAQYLKDVAASSVNYVHPCHVRTCDKTTLAGKHFEWDKPSLSLKQVGPADSCGAVGDCNALRFDLCSDDGSLPLQHFAAPFPLPTPPSCIH